MSAVRRAYASNVSGEEWAFVAPYLLLLNDLPPWEVIYQQMARRIHIAVDTLGHLLAAHVTSASEQARAQVGELSKAVQGVTSESFKLSPMLTRARPAQCGRPRPRATESSLRW